MSTRNGLLGGPQRITVPIIRKRPDAELVQALSAHAGLVLQTAARITGSLAEAQDVAQDLAEKLLRKPPRDVRSWPALLKTMAVNASIDRTRRRREVGEPAEPVSLDGPDKALEQEQQAAVLRRALEDLSERDAQLFSFYYFADLSHADIGRQLDMKPNAVTVALHRIRHRLGENIRSKLDEIQQEGASS